MSHDIDISGFSQPQFRRRHRSAMSDGWTRRRGLCLCVSALCHGIALAWIATVPTRQHAQFSVEPSHVMEIVLQEFPVPLPAQADTAPERPAPRPFEPTLSEPETERPVSPGLWTIDPAPMMPQLIETDREAVPLPPRELATIEPPSAGDANVQSVVNPVANLDAALTRSSTVVRQANPLYEHNPAPSYPRKARERGWQGTTWLRVEVLSDGRAGVVEILHTSGYDLLDNTSVQAVRTWRFQPATRGNQAIASWVEIPIRFALVSG
jgi:protein TonB